MRQQYRMEVALTLLGPILTRGLTAEPGVDAPIARDGIGRPMLPFSLVKGKVRDAFGDLRPANDPSVTDWLGKASGKDLDPERGRLRFTDFTTEEKGDPEGLIERVEIDAKSGSVVPRHLAVLEAPFGYGQPVEFRGAVEFAADAEESPKIVDALDQAFRWVPAYGAMRTVGFGRTQKVATSVAPCPERSKGSPGGTTSFPLRLRFDRPLCLVGRKHSGNHFESLECVPGAVLKGAVARLVLDLIGSSARALDPRSPSPRWPTLSRCFEHVRFSEARPMSETATHGPVVPPLSLVTTPTRKGEYFDVALEPGPRLIAGAAPAFAPDWKEADESFIREAFGWPTLPRERRTRTSIEAGKGRALDQSLFSYGLVLPRSRRPGRSIESFVWETSVGVEHKDIAKTDRAAIVSELADLLAHGLPGVGKTRATAEVEWLKSPSAPKVAGGAPPGASEHVVTLQTEFLMTGPETVPGRPA